MTETKKKTPPDYIMITLEGYQLDSTQYDELMSGMKAWWDTFHNQFHDNFLSWFIICELVFLYTSRFE